MGPPAAILRSNPDGSAWDVRHSTPIEAERAFPWVLVDHRRKIVVAVEARGEMRVSHDDGINWQSSVIDTAPGTWPFWQGVVLEREGVFLVAGEAGKAVRSLDAHSWQTVTTGTDKDLFGSFADETGEHPVPHGRRGHPAAFAGSRYHLAGHELGHTATNCAA